MKAPIRVLCIGPSPDLMGGISNVMRQMRDLDFMDKYRIDVFPLTLCQREAESGPAKAARHLMQRLKLGRLMRRTRPAIVHIHTCSGASFRRAAWDLRVVARGHGCRTILHMHGAQFDRYFAEADWLEQGFIRSTLESADCVVALSQGWADKLRNMAPAAAIAVIENAVEHSPSPPIRQLHPVCRFLTLARMDTWKGIDDLLDACAILKRWGIEFQFTLAGPEGSAGDTNRLQQKIHQRDLTSNVTYVGPLSEEPKKRYLQESDVFVQPSHHEGMPLSILEALAQALPIVATAVGAVPEVMEDDVHGFLVPPHQPESLARAMGRLAIDEPRRTDLGSAGFRRAKSRFTLVRFRNDLIELYDRLLLDRAANRSSDQDADGKHPRHASQAGLAQQVDAA